MIARLARIHHQPQGLLPVLRSLLGWSIAVGGLVILLMQLAAGMPALDGPLADAALGGAMAAAATALGAAPVLLMRQIGAGVQGMLLGFGAGVMLAASVFSLLLPGFDAAVARGYSDINATLLMACGLMLGAGLLLALDRALPHTHAPGRMSDLEGRHPAQPQPGNASRLAQAAHSGAQTAPLENRSVTAVWLFVLAIAVHNIPEGLAIGVAASETGSGNAVATGISLQNVPEGLIIAIALVSAGYKRFFSFVIAALSGMVEPMAAIIGSVMVSTSAALLPWGLAAAAGAMLFVVSHEIIPESHKRGHETLATTGLMLGFVIMMMLDTLLG